MTSFGASTTTDDVLAGVDLQGRRFFLTGASAGLGEDPARAAALWEVSERLVGVSV